MKPLLLILCVISTLCMAAPVEHPEFAELDAQKAKLQKALAEIHSLYRDDGAFLRAFDTAQKKWVEYCAAMLEARLPLGGLGEFVYPFCAPPPLAAAVGEARR